MSLPPIANFFAVYSLDPQVLLKQKGRWAARSEFAEVWSPAPGWMVGWAPFPNCLPEPASIRENGLVFAEGSEAIAAESRETSELFFQKLAEAVDQKPERLAEYPGDFTFIRFRADGSATAVRACAGLAPLYYHRAPERIAIGTRLGYFVRYLGLAELDPLVNAIWACGQCFFPDGRTPITKVSCARRGSFITVNRGQYQTGAYWHPRIDPLPFPAPAEQDEHARCLRELLIRKLECHLHPNGGNLLTLSGGVDSACLASLARGVVDRPVMTWSLLPQPANLYEEEMSYIRPLREEFRFERTWEARLTLEYRMGNAGNLANVLFPVGHPALLALPGLLSEASICVFFGGEFADEVCGSHFTLNDWVWMASPFRLTRQVAQRRIHFRDLLRWIKQNVLKEIGPRRLAFPPSLSELMAPSVQAEYSGWRNSMVRLASNDCPTKYCFAACVEHAEFITMNWEALSSLGIHRLVPFYNREIIELAFSCHPEELIVPGTKKILQRALRDDVPARNLYRPTKGAWGAHLRSATCHWEALLPTDLRNIIRGDLFSNETKVLPYAVALQLKRLCVFATALNKVTTSG